MKLESIKKPKTFVPFMLTVETPHEAIALFTALGNTSLGDIEECFDMRCNENLMLTLNKKSDSDKIRDDVSNMYDAIIDNLEEQTKELSNCGVR